MLKTTALVAVLGLLAATAQAQPACQTCPSDAQTSAIGSGIGIFRYNTTTGTLVPYTSGTLTECTTLLIQANVSYVPIVTDPGGNEFVGAGFTAGTGWLVIDEGDNGSAEFACDITPANMATTIVGGTGPNACPGSVSVKNMRTFIYNPTPGVTTVRIRFNYTNGIVLLGDCTDRVSATPDRSVTFSACLDDGDPCTTDSCETATLTPAQYGDALNSACVTVTGDIQVGDGVCVHTPLCTDPCNPCVVTDGVAACTPLCADPCSPCVVTDGVAACTPLCDDPCNPCVVTDGVAACTPLCDDPCNPCVVTDGVAACTPLCDDPCNPCVVTDGVAACTPLCDDPCNPCVVTDGVAACTPLCTDPCNPCVVTDGVAACTPLCTDPCSPCVVTDGVAACTPLCTDPCNPCVVTAGVAACTTMCTDPCFPCVVTDGVAACATTSICGQNGCTPGFWKNCVGQWCNTYTTGQHIDTVFTVPDCIPGASGLRSKSLLQGLSLQGGSGLNGAAQTLLRAGVAALLNACKDIGYPLSTDQVISQVNGALASCDRATILTLASTLDADNNLGCKDRDGNGLKCLR